jgi:hypothetical protein
MQTKRAISDTRSAIPARNQGPRVSTSLWGTDLNGINNCTRVLPKRSDRKRLQTEEDAASPHDSGNSPQRRAFTDGDRRALT